MGETSNSLCLGWSDGRLGWMPCLVRGGGLLHTIGVLREHACLGLSGLGRWLSLGWLVSAPVWGVGAGWCVLFENCIVDASIYARSESFFRSLLWCCNF